MYHVIVNPKAGKRRAKKSLNTLKRVFDEHGVPYAVYETARAGEAKELAARLTALPLPQTAAPSASSAPSETTALTDEPVKLVVVGGDGTLHEVLGGIADPARCLLGLIPAGTGNDFAAAAGIPENAEKAAKLLLNGEAKPTDFLEVGGVRCMNIAGLGIDVDVLVRCSRGKLKGKIKYLISLIQSMFAFKGVEVSFENGGKEETFKGMLAAACNGTKFGGGIQICPAAKIDDGLIDVVAVDFIGGVFSIVKAFAWLMRGKVLDYPLTRHFRAERVSVRTKAPCAVQLDGEIYENLNFSVEVKRGLRVYR